MSGRTVPGTGWLGSGFRRMFGRFGSDAEFAPETFDFTEPLYARGYIVSRRPVPAPHPQWRSARIGDLFIHHDPRNRFASARRGGHFVAIIGLAIDTQEPDRAPQETVSRACAALATSKSRFFDTIEAWGGRFIVLFGNDRMSWAASDATGMRTIFHSPAHPGLVASHAALVAEAVGGVRNAEIDVLKASEAWATKRARYLPGVLTPWTDVHFLTANTALSLTNGAILRFWPRQPLGQATVDAAAATVADLMGRQMRWLQAQRRPILCSLTGGLDSRVTAAAARNVADIRYFTYCRPGSQGDGADALEAGRIAERLQIPHAIVPTGRRAAPEAAAVMLRNHEIPHFPQVAEAYARTFSQDCIHIRSNISEIGRAFYKESFDSGNFDAKNMAKIWRNMQRIQIAVDAFDQWRKSVGFQKASSIVDMPDLFYWEHRMPCWHGSLILESDLAFDTVSLFNHRKLLSTLLMVGLEERKTSAVHHRLIAACAPEVAAARLDDPDPTSFPVARGPRPGEAR